MIDNSKISKCPFPVEHLFVQSQAKCQFRLAQTSAYLQPSGRERRI